MKRFIASTKIFSHPKPREQVYHLLSANPFRGSIFLNTKCNEQGYILFFLAHRTKRHYHSTKYKHFHAIIYSCGSDSIQRPVYCQSPAFDNRVTDALRLCGTPDERRATGGAQTRHIHARKQPGDGFRERMRPQHARCGNSGQDDRGCLILKKDLQNQKILFLVTTLKAFTIIFPASTCPSGGGTGRGL